MPSVPPESSAALRLDEGVPDGPGVKKAMPDFDRLTMAEIDEIFQTIYAIQRKLEQERLEASERRWDAEDQGATYIPRKTKKLRETDGWQKDTEVREQVVNNHRLSHGETRALQLHAIRLVAEKIIAEGQGDENSVYKREIGNENYEYYYRLEFIRELRTRLIEIMARGQPKDEVIWRDPKKRPKGSRMLFLEAIVKFMKDRDVGAFSDIFDNKGNLAECCTRNDYERICKIFSQLRMQRGFRDPAVLVAAINRQKKEHQDLTLEQLMELAEQFAEGRGDLFRPAINYNGSPVTSIAKELCIQLREHYGLKGGRI